MKDFYKYISVIALLFVASSAISQCFADFDFDDSSLVVNFTNKSLQISNDSIISYNWDFGDTGTSDDASPLHIYAQSGAYDVTLIIDTELGCADTLTQSIYICSFNLDYDLQTNCDEDSKVSLDLFIRDTYSSAGQINVFLDNKLLHDTPLITINDTISISTELLADGLEHTIDIISIDHPTCMISEIIQVTPCVPPCFLSELKAQITNTSTVNASVTQSGFNPIVLNVTTGDTIVYTWDTDNRSVTSNPNNNGQTWDSGILNTGDQFELYSFAPGIFTYSSSNTSNGMFEGSLVSTCPDSAYYNLLLTFQHAEQTGAYDLWVDGVPSDLLNMPYSNDGFDTIQLIMPGDGILHTYQVLDSDSPSCNMSAAVQAPLCGVESVCNLFVSAAQSTPCDQDSIVDVAFTILSAGGGINGFDLYIDDILFEANIPYTGTKTIITRSLFGDGEEHIIRVEDTAKDTCESTTTILLEDCTQSCLILNAFAGVGSNKSFVNNVLDNTFLPKDITISAGDKVIWQWQTDSLRSVTSIDFLFDSGVNSQGASYTSPILPVGVYKYFSEFNGMEGSITVAPNCEGSLIPIIYNFNKFGGANTGYDIYVDSIKINGVPISYSANGNNTGNSFVSGDGESHQVQIVDAVDSTCSAIEFFDVPFCDASICALFIDNPIISDCNDNNTIDLSLDLESFNTLDSLFSVTINGLIADTLVYDTSGITTINLNLPGNGDLYEIIISDLNEANCTSSFSFTAPLCDNACMFDYLSIEYQLEEVEDTCFDGNIQIIVSTEAIHNFNSDYTISLTSDNINIQEVFSYPFDGLISHIFTLPASGDLVNIILSNNIDNTCMRDTTFNLYSCNPDPCRVELIDVAYGECRDGGLMDMMIEIDTFRISDSLSILFDDEEIFRGSYTNFYNSTGFEISYTNEERTLTLVDIANPNCMSEDSFFTQFCTTDCTLDVTYMLSDSCILDEDASYDIILTGTVLNAVSDSILLDLVSSNISKAYSYDNLLSGITLTISREDDNPTLGIFDLADDSCRQFLPIEAPTCILDCNISIDSVMVSEDNCTNGIQTLMLDISYGYQDADSLQILIDEVLVSTELYPMDSLLTISIAGDGMPRSVMVRDRLNELCADTLEFLVDACEYSCEDFMIDFDIAIDTLTKTVTYTDATTGGADKWNWDFGDNTVSSDANPFHTYTDFGTYTICLTAQNEEEGCIQTICKDIELIDIACDADFVFTVDGFTVSFESLSTSAEDISELLWTIDDQTTLADVMNGSFTSTETGDIELCLSIETITGCSSIICETVELFDPCTIVPSFDTSVSFDTIQLINTSTGNYTTTSWSFGDGITFSGSEVEYTYPQDGDYEVCMTVIDSETDNCEFTICEMVTINSCNINPVFVVSINQDTLNAGLITPLSDLDISWDFGNGFSANIDPVQFVYTIEGDYTVCATITDNDLDNCTETHCEDISIILTNIASELLSDIEVYPNPIQIGESVRIVNTERLDLKIELFTSNGQKVPSSISNHGDHYMLSTIALIAGKYLVKISSHNESITKSIILIE